MQEKLEFICFYRYFLHINTRRGWFAWVRAFFFFYFLLYLDKTLCRLADGLLCKNCTSFIIYNKVTAVLCIDINQERIKNA